MRNTAIAFLLLCSVTLAGCSDAGTADDVELDLPPPPPGLGHIRGVVVDDTIAPVAGATVSVLSAEASTMTDEEGAFRFTAMEPGSHFLRVEKPGFHTVQQSVEVRADITDPPVARILLSVDAETRPHVMELVWDGFIECSTTYVALCAVPNIVSDALGEPPLTNDEFIVYHELDDPDPDWVQSEIFWESTQELSDRLWLWHSYADGQGTFQGSFGETTGTSPLMIAHSREELQAAAANATSFDHANWQLVVRVFSGDIDGTTPPVCVLFCNGPGVTINQEFRVLTHVFYNQPPEDGWRFSEHGSPPNTV